MSLPPGHSAGESTAGQPGSDRDARGPEPAGGISPLPRQPGPGRSAGSAVPEHHGPEHHGPEPDWDPLPDLPDLSTPFATSLRPARTGAASRSGVVAIVILTVAVLALVISASLLAGRALSSISWPGLQLPDRLPGTSGGDRNAGGGSGADGGTAGSGLSARDVRLPRPLTFARVTSARPGRCPATATDRYETQPPGRECLQLGGGFRVRHLDEIAVQPPSGSTRYALRISLDERGTRGLAELTRTAARDGSADRIALVSGRQVISAPTVNGPITASTIVVTGDFDRAAARRLYTQITG